MSKGRLQIHSENILPIIKKWLYSDRDIFVRELVSNACDAIRKLKILRDQGQAQVQDSEFRIDVQIDKTAKILRFTDTGIGMTAEEVEKYIAQIAFSGAEDFVEKYQSHQEKDQFIGHFGLGFYSAYMVADLVEIQTLSYLPDAEPVHWSCDGSSDYVLEKGSRTTRGTEIILHISSDHEDFLDEHFVRTVLERYCQFLPYPIYLNDNRINTQEPLWVKTPQDCTEQEYKAFYRHLYPMEDDPLFWVHLNVDYPFHLKGILYFPKLKKKWDFKKTSIKLYCNRVYVSDHCQEIVPEYLLPLKGVIDSPDIPLNVSRSYLQMDRTVKQLSSHISKKVADSLSSLFKTDRERFVHSWDDISIVVKLGAVEDDKFYQKVKDLLIWKSIKGEWLTAEEYLNRHRTQTQETIFYTTHENQHLPILDLYTQKNIDVIIATSPIDPYLMNLLEKELTPVKFKRVDANLDDTLVDNERAKTVLDADGKTEAARWSDFFRSKLGDEQIEVEAKSLASDALPGFVMFDENQRRFRDYMQSIDPSQSASLAKLDKRTFIINTNNPLIHSLYKLDAVDPSISKELVQELYQLSLLSQREIDPDTLNDFIKRTHQVLEHLVSKIVSDPQKK